jgi:hypothetical protein
LNASYCYYHSETATLAYLVYLLLSSPLFENLFSSFFLPCFHIFEIRYLDHFSTAISQTIWNIQTTTNNSTMSSSPLSVLSRSPTPPPSFALPPAAAPSRKRGLSEPDLDSEEAPRAFKRIRKPSVRALEAAAAAPRKVSYLLFLLFGTLRASDVGFGVWNIHGLGQNLCVFELLILDLGNSSPC